MGLISNSVPILGIRDIIIVNSIPIVFWQVTLMGLISNSLPTLDILMSLLGIKSVLTRLISISIPIWGIDIIIVN